MFRGMRTPASPQKKNPDYDNDDDNNYNNIDIFLVSDALKISDIHVYTG
jgi:hypothetical protein